jgi:hypothetical protein
MTNNAFGASEADERRNVEPGENAAPLPVDRELLESVLEQTLLGESPASPADPTVVAALKHVAELHRGRPFELAPLVEMVEAVLGEPYRRLAGDADAWRTMTSGIAQTLYDDPASRRRLHDLWRRLTGSEA